MKRCFILLPDGVGLRNFVFTDFYELGRHAGFDITYWNNTILPLNEKFGYNDLLINYSKSHPLTDIYKRARKEIELNQNYTKFKDSAYLSYRFPKSYGSVKNALKSCLVSLLVVLNNSEKGLLRIRTKMFNLERKSQYYAKAKTELEKFKPSFVFCTNQRPLSGIAPIIAARDLDIPTGTFIFSWDNLPKATMIVETDYYFVWSEYMKDELIKYYPFISENQIKIVGTPQFSPHFDKDNYIEKSEFFKEHQLDLNKKYICFSGDDVTTSPYDQFYLEDLAHCVRELNTLEGKNLGIIYRKCPVDFTDRHKEVVLKYSDEITCIDPLWKNLGNGWNQVMPTAEDAQLLVNTVRYSNLIINVGSSMVFDAVIHDIPCAFINYNTVKGDPKKWDIDKIYRYIHFKSMPSKKAVYWINEKFDFKDVIKKSVDYEKNLDTTKLWFNKICLFPQDQASKNIWNAIKSIIV